MKTFYDYVFCRDRGCPRIDCLRYPRNMEYNALSMVNYNWKSQGGNGCDKLLLNDPERPELDPSRFGHEADWDSYRERYGEAASAPISNFTEADQRAADYVNDTIRHSRATIYIEPFVGNSKTFDKVTGIQAKYGTDIDPDKVAKKQQEYGLGDKSIRAADWKIWIRVLSDKNYKGKCIFYCDMPRDSETFSFGDFMSRVTTVARDNRVFARTHRLKRRKPALELGDDDFLYWI